MVSCRSFTVGVLSELEQAKAQILANSIDISKVSQETLRQLTETQVKHSLALQEITSLKTTLQTSNRQREQERTRLAAEMDELRRRLVEAESGCMDSKEECIRLTEKLNTAEREPHIIIIIITIVVIIIIIITIVVIIIIIITNVVIIIIIITIVVIIIIIITIVVIIIIIITIVVIIIIIIITIVVIIIIIITIVVIIIIIITIVVIIIIIITIVVIIIIIITNVVIIIIIIIITIVVIIIIITIVTKMANAARTSLQKARDNEVSAMKQQGRQREQNMSVYLQETEKKHTQVRVELEDMLESQLQISDRLKEECRKFSQQLDDGSKRSRADIREAQQKIDKGKSELSNMTSKCKTLENQVQHKDKHLTKLNKKIAMLEKNVQKYVQQIYELLLKQNSFMKDRQTLTREVEYWRQQTLQSRKQDDMTRDTESDIGIADTTVTQAR
ncbi:hypothetical protein QZH41_008956 [Actinostola sp. cb2023]|nr:hypothetical protein QZH41_008956 [Actinostola sp. cb2023]